MPFFQTLWSTNVGCKTLQWSKPSSCYQSNEKLKLCQTVHLLWITSDKTQKDYCWDSSISQSHKGVYVLHKRGLWDPSISLTAKTNYCRWDPSISQSWWMHVTTTETFGNNLSECYASTYRERLFSQSPSLVHRWCTQRNWKNGPFKRNHAEQLVNAFKEKRGTKTWTSVRLSSVTLFEHYQKDCFHSLPLIPFLVISNHQIWNQNAWSITWRYA